MTGETKVFSVFVCNQNNRDNQVSLEGQIPGRPDLSKILSSTIKINPINQFRLNIPNERVFDSKTILFDRFSV